MSAKAPKPTDPLFLAVEARLVKQDATTRPDRVKAFVEALESQIQGSQPQEPQNIPVDPGSDAIGKRGIFWNGPFHCEYSGECIGIKDGKYLDTDADPYAHFLSIESLIPEALA